jgi:hypothetical protein
VLPDEVRRLIHLRASVPGKASMKFQQSRMVFQEVETIYVVGELKSSHRNTIYNGWVACAARKHCADRVGQFL